MSRGSVSLRALNTLREAGRALNRNYGKGFLDGFGALIHLWPARRHPLTYQGRGLKGDVEQVGQDMWKAIRQYDDERPSTSG